MAQLDKIRLSGTTYDIIDATAVHSLDGYWTTGETTAAITAATNALAESIAEQGYQTSGDVQNAISGKVDTDTYTAYTAATDTVLGGKADTTAVTEAISEAVSGKLDTSTFETYSGNVDTALASKIAGAAWDSQTSHLNFYDNVSATGSPLTYVDGADWVKDSFLKSVTIEDKEISGETVTCLVFVFETESGETETDIPLTDIFDPDNYVNMSTYTAYTAATEAVISDKAETTAVTEAISEATSGKADVSTTVTDVRISADTTQYGFTNLNAYKTINGTETTAGTFGGFHTDGRDGLVKDDLGVLKVNTNVIQEKLSSGTNIKTINNESILGSGNLTIDTGNKVEVSGTTLVFL